MRKIITLLLVTTLTFSNGYSNTVKETPPKLAIINGKLYKEKNGMLFPLVGVVIEFIAPKIIGELKEMAINYIKDLFAEKEIEVLDDNQGTREDVEVITIHADDTDSDGNFELSSESEDHNNDGEEDNETEPAEYDDYKTGLEQIVDDQLEYIDHYYQGDVDGDGTEE